MILDLLLPVAAASVVGSVHCAGMCGPFVAVAAAGSEGSRRILPLLAYNFGRLASYVALGAAAGALGQALDVAGRAAGIGRIAAVLSGSIMVLWGSNALLESQGVRVFRGRLALPPQIAGSLARIRQLPPLARAALLGLGTTLLPCGWLYAFAVSAAGTASPLRGALLMLAFWTGNVPLLLGLGVALGAALGPIRRHLPVLSAAVIFCVGLFTITTRANLPALAASTVTHCRLNGAAPLPRVADCPCHGKHH